MDDEPRVTRVGLAVIAREWARLGCIGFGGPPTHISLLRRLCVDERHWMSGSEFEDAVAATNLLPGPASTQLAIYCAWRLRGNLGGLIGGLCFIVPGLLVILALSAAFLAKHPEHWIVGAARGAGAAVPAVALLAAWRFVPASRQRRARTHAAASRWFLYIAVGGASAALAGEFLCCRSSGAG